MKLRQSQFYCVKCKKAVTIPVKDIYVDMFKNPLVGFVPALRAVCRKCKTNVTKFIKHSSQDKMIKKYGGYVLV